MEAFHESVKDVEVTAEAARPVGTVGAVVSGSMTRIEFRLKYCRSANIFRTCLPVAIGTPCLPTHWNALHPPVLGTMIGPVTSCPSISTWKALFASALLARLSILYWALAATLMV